MANNKNWMAGLDLLTLFLKKLPVLGGIGFFLE